MKIILKKILIRGIIIYYILTIPFVCFADLMPWPPVPKPEPTLILDLIIQFIIVLLINLVINSVIAFVGYLIIKKGIFIKSFKFLKYIFLITLGGILIDFIFVVGRYMSRIKGPFYPDFGLMNAVLLVSIIFSFFGLLFYNYWLSRKIFGLSKKQGIFLGLIIAIFTHPILSSVISTYSEFFDKILTRF